MRIVRADVSLVVRPTDEPFVIDWATINETAYLVCRLRTDDDSFGLGYAFFFDADHARAIASLMITLLHQALDGVEVIDPYQLVKRLRSRLALTGQSGIAGTCVAAIEMALWDLRTKALGLTWAQATGHAGRRSYPAYLTCGAVSASPDQVAREVEAAIATGYRLVKIKVGADRHRDEARLAAARKAAGDSVKIAIDVNQTWDFIQAVDTAARWHETYDLLWIEEPLPADDLVGLRRLHDRSPSPLAVGESYYGVSEFRTIIADQCADILTVNPQRVGGVARFQQIVESCNLNGIAVTCHTFPELAAQLLLGADAVPGVEVVPWMLGVFDRLPVLHNGVMCTPDGMGLAIELSADSVEWTRLTEGFDLDSGPEVF